MTSKISLIHWLYALYEAPNDTLWTSFLLQATSSLHLSIPSSLEEITPEQFYAHLVSFFGDVIEIPVMPLHIPWNPPVHLFALKGLPQDYFLYFLEYTPQHLDLQNHPVFLVTSESSFYLACSVNSHGLTCYLSQLIS